LSGLLENKFFEILLLLAVLSIFSFIHWQFGMLLFHTLIESTTVFIGFMMFTIAFSTKKIIRNDFLIFLGIGFFFISILDTLHVITVPGMAFSPEISPQVTLHLWIYTRLLEAILLLLAPYFILKPLNETIAFILLASITLFITWLAFTHETPILINEDGLTSFKNNTEYLIILIMLSTIVFYFQQRKIFSKKIFKYLIVALVFGVFSEYAFTLYLNFSSVAFTTGHLLKLISFWAIYQAIVQTTLNIPIKALSRIANAYDLLPHPTISINNRGIINRTNCAAVSFAKTLHAPISDGSSIIGCNIHDIFHPEEIKKENCPLCHYYQRTTSISAELIHFPKTNKQYEFYNQLIDDDDDDDKTFVQIFVDVTEMKEAYAKLNSITQQLIYTQANAKIGSWNLNLVTNKFWWSDEIFSIFEVDPNKFNASYEAFLNAIHPQDREQVNNTYLNSLKTKKSYQIEHRLLMEDGRVKFVYEQCETIFDNDGNPIESTGSVQDVTQQHEMTQALKHAEKMDALGNLTGGIAHDFNNLLGVILGYNELLKAKLAGDSKLINYTNSIEKAGNRGADLVRKLLSFSKNKNPDVSIININQIIDSSKDLISKTLTSAIEFETNLFKGLWDVQVNTHDFDDIILNLSINSSHAMPNGGKLDISTENINISPITAKSLNIKGGDFVCLTIEDNGCGMTNKVKNRIFEPFFTTKGSKGTGLGLSQVYGFVQSASGAIEVESHEGEGTCFMLYLPRYKAHD